MRNHCAAAAAAITFALVAANAAAQEVETTTINGLTGPAAPKNMTIEDREMIDLNAEFPEAGLDGRFMRGRFVVVGPEGVVPIHTHDGRPAITYVLNGTIIEHRSDVEGPITHEAGAITFDDEGISQWWENPTDETIRLWVVDFLTQGVAADHN